MTTQTYQATYETGWHATVRAGSMDEARGRCEQTGRGERFELKATAASCYQVWGRDEDDDYEED